MNKIKTIKMKDISKMFTAIWIDKKIQINFLTVFFTHFLKKIQTQNKIKN